jgi:hypothetical protein
MFDYLFEDIGLWDKIGVSFILFIVGLFFLVGIACLIGVFLTVLWWLTPDIHKEILMMRLEKWRNGEEKEKAH